MIVTCKYNEGIHLSNEAPDERNKKYSLLLEKDYRVFALSTYSKKHLDGLYRSITCVLVYDEANLPRWYPINAFIIKDRKVPKKWFLSYNNDQNAIENIEEIYDITCGYEEIVFNKSHAKDLLAQAPEALEIFYKEKAKRELEDKWHETALVMAKNDKINIICPQCNKGIITYFDTQKLGKTQRHVICPECCGNESIEIETIN